MRSYKKAVIIVGHGSKRRGFEAAMVRVAGALRKKRDGLVLCAYLGSASPSVPEAISRCVRRGAREIVVVPYFVLAGDHVARDIPEMVRQAAEKHRGKTKVRLSPYLGYHAKIVSVVQERIRQAR